MSACSATRELRKPLDDCTTTDQPQRQSDEYDIYDEHDYTTSLQIKRTFLHIVHSVHTYPSRLMLFIQHQDNPFRASIYESLFGTQSQSSPQAHDHATKKQNTRPGKRHTTPDVPAHGEDSRGKTAPALNRSNGASRKALGLVSPAL